MESSFFYKGSDNMIRRIISNSMVADLKEKKY